MKKILGTALLLASTVSMAATDNYLFLQTASQGNLVKNKDNSYTLTLEHSPKYVDYFTDRPERKAGMVTLEQFVQLWKSKAIKNNFSEVPPNAAIAVKPVGGVPEHFIAEVTKPTYSNNTLSYKLKIISSNKVHIGKLVHVNMFFDDIPWNPGGF